MKEYFTYKYDDLFNPTLKAIKALGDSATISEIEDEVIRLLNLSDEAINEIHRGSTTKLTYRLGWARNYLKNYGLIDNSTRGVWALTEKGQKTDEVNQEEVKRYVNNKYREERRQASEISNKPYKSESDEPIVLEAEESDWKENLLDTIKSIRPEQFEKLCQRLLRELGFVDVDVTGKSHDGGIDGKGILKIGGILSFRVVFQAKRFQESVSSRYVRDFRGAMQGRADKGLIMTTGTFSRSAKLEAQRDGAIQIDLIDGNEFAQRLKELKLGVEVEKVEKVTVKKEWFDSI